MVDCGFGPPGTNPSRSHCCQSEKNRRTTFSTFSGAMNCSFFLTRISCNIRRTERTNGWLTRLARNGKHDFTGQSSASWRLGYLVCNQVFSPVSLWGLGAGRAVLRMLLMQISKLNPPKGTRIYPHISSLHRTCPLMQNSRQARPVHGSSKQAPSTLTHPSKFLT